MILCALPISHPIQEAGNLALSHLPGQACTEAVMLWMYYMPVAEDGFILDLLSLCHLTISQGFLGWVVALYRLLLQ